MNWRTNHALVENFNVKSSNELTNVSRRVTFTVAGMGDAAATSVTVNSLAAMLYGDNTFARAGFTVADGNNTFTAVALDVLGLQPTKTVTHRAHRVQRSLAYGCYEY